MSRRVRSESVVVFGALEVDLSQLDLNDHSSRVAWLRTSSIVFIVLVVTTVSLRIFARTTYVRKIFSDDGVAHSTIFLRAATDVDAVLIISATVFTVALASTCIAGRLHLYLSRTASHAQQRP